MQFNRAKLIKDNTITLSFNYNLGDFNTLSSKCSKNALFSIFRIYFRFKKKFF